MKIKSIYIITDAPIPIGFASTNRILSYANGFEENGIAASIIIHKKTEEIDAPLNIEVSGKIGSISFRYLSKSTLKAKSFMGRRYDKLVMPFRLFLFSLHNFNPSTPIIYYSNYWFPAISLRISSFFKGFVFLREESEHPDVYLKHHSNVWKRFVQKQKYRLFDGLILMTNNLVEYFNKEFTRKPQVHIPMTVDLNRFNLKKTISKGNSIVYCGYLNDRKDGIHHLLNVFKKITIKHPDYKLVLIGEAENIDHMNNYLSFVKQNNLQDKVDFMGNMSNSLIPKMLVNATILILPRPASIQAKYGFPTKLGEYLASGNPVVVTAVGEIPFYLKDGESAFIALPDDENSLYNKLSEAIEHPEKARLIGLKGKQIANESFNNIIQTKKLLNFIEKTF